MTLSNIKKHSNKLMNEDFQCWCSHCDEVFVDSHKKGKLFSVNGHVQENDGKLGNYEAVFFTVCNGCLNSCEKSV